MGKRRNSEVELCFDSMTDLITNLAGGLVLIVLLLLGITRDAPPPVPEKPKPVAKVGTKTEEKSIRPLQDRLNQLRIELDAANKDMQVMDNKIPELRREVDELLKQSAPAPGKK